MLNARSLKNKTSEFVDFVIEHDLDIAGVCETWLTADDMAPIGHVTPYGYSFKHVPRKDRRGGGVGVLYRSDLQIKFIDSLDMQTFELIHLDINHQSRNLRLIIIYRPPNSSTLKTFLDEFSTILDDEIFNSSDLLSYPEILTSQWTHHFQAPNPSLNY